MLAQMHPPPALEIKSGSHHPLWNYIFFNCFALPTGYQSHLGNILRTTQQGVYDK